MQQVDVGRLEAFCKMAGVGRGIDAGSRLYRFKIGCCPDEVIYGSSGLFQLVKKTIGFIVPAEAIIFRSDSEKRQGADEDSSPNPARRERFHGIRFCQGIGIKIRIKQGRENGS